jgi:hypothetical protein
MRFKCKSLIRLSLMITRVTVTRLTILEKLQSYICMHKHQYIHTHTHIYIYIDTHMTYIHYKHTYTNAHACTHKHTHTHTHTYTPNTVVKWLTPLLRIRKVRNSNLGPETGYPQNFSSIHQSIQASSLIVP